MQNAAARESYNNQVLLSAWIFTNKDTLYLIWCNKHIWKQIMSQSSQGFEWYRDNRRICDGRRSLGDEYRTVMEGGH